MKRLFPLVLGASLLGSFACDDKKADEKKTDAKKADEKKTDAKAEEKKADAAPTPTPTDASKAPPPAAEPAKADPPAAKKVSPELTAVDEMIAPILAMTDEAARTKAACKDIAKITRQIATVADHPPAGIDATAWREAGERMNGALGDFEIECGEGEASSTDALSKAVEMRKDLEALLAK